MNKLPQPKDPRLVQGILLTNAIDPARGIPQALVDFKGRPLIDYAIESISPFCHSIAISANHASFSAYNYKTVADDLPGAGPLGSLTACMRHILADYYLISACSTPLISPRVYWELLMAAGDGVSAVASGPNGVEPLVACYHRTALYKMDRYLRAGRHNMADVISSLPAVVIPFHDTIFADGLNFPENLG